MDSTSGQAAYALEGARAAVARIKTTYRASDSTGAAEAASWVSALEGVLAEARGGTEPEGALVRDCERDGVRDLLDGLRYVRNHAAHGLAHLVELGGGLTVPFTVPFTIETSMRWRGDDLPEPVKESRRLITAYRVALAGQDVGPTLGRAIEWLEVRAGV